MHLENVRRLQSDMILSRVQNLFIGLIPMVFLRNDRTRDMTFLLSFQEAGTSSDDARRSCGTLLRDRRYTDTRACRGSGQRRDRQH